MLVLNAKSNEDAVSFPVVLLKNVVNTVEILDAVSMSKGHSEMARMKSSWGGDYVEM